MTSKNAIIKTIQIGGILFGVVQLIAGNVVPSIATLYLVVAIGTHMDD